MDRLDHHHHRRRNHHHHEQATLEQEWLLRVNLLTTNKSGISSSLIRVMLLIRQYSYCMYLVLYQDDCQKFCSPLYLNGLGKSAPSCDRFFEVIGLSTHIGPTARRPDSPPKYGRSAVVLKGTRITKLNATSTTFPPGEDVTVVSISTDLFQWSNSDIGDPRIPWSCYLEQDDLRHKFPVTTLICHLYPMGSHDLV